MDIPTVWETREEIAITADDLREIINRNAGYQGRALNPVNPILNAQMRNGARVNAVLNPVCDPYIAVTIRVHRLIARTFEDLVNLGTLSVSAASWLWLAIRSGLSTVVGGGTGAGKTNLLNALVSVMPANLRCVVIEDTRELTLPANDVPYLVTVQGSDGQVTINQRMLVANALRMRPDRIILGEVRDAAAWDAVKACNTGHEGTMLSVHAEDAAGVLVRLAQLCGEAHETANIPERMLREVIASAFQMVVFIERRRQPDGSFKRFVTQINEINGFVSDGVTVQKPLFRYENGELRWSQQWPHDRIKKRILDAGFVERDIEQALTGRARFWEIPF
ncbi:MAG: CpaF family protein [Anaerolineae bacterium]|nr:CpaF family protein [Anaerolineae bacterium]